jgi:hypothetical protein
MLWNYKAYSADLLARLYLYYRENFRRNDVDLGSGIELLMWALGVDLTSQEWENPEWLNLLTRMLSVERKLQESTRAKLSQKLLDFVAPKCRKETRAWWRPEYVRIIVFRELGLGQSPEGC